jgi:hypothetical protein
VDSIMAYFGLSPERNFYNLSLAFGSGISEASPKRRDGRHAELQS